VALWPDRFVVNAPVRHLLFGRGIEAPPEDACSPGCGARRRPAAAVRGRAAGVRFLRFTAGGDLLASQPRSGRVVRLEADRDGDGRSDGRHEVVGGLDRPHGLDLHEGWLYVAETGAVGRIRFDAVTGAASGTFERVVTGLPAGGNHWTRTLRFSPDGWMVVSIGSSCNACVEEDARRASMMRFRPDGSGAEVHATGLRNSVGFDWAPGRRPPLRDRQRARSARRRLPSLRAQRVVPGGFYGWPVANGDRVPDPDLGRDRRRASARRSRPSTSSGPTTPLSE